MLCANQFNRYHDTNVNLVNGTETYMYITQHHQDYSYERAKVCIVVKLNSSVHMVVNYASHFASIYPYANVMIQYSFDLFS